MSQSNLNESAHKPNESKAGGISARLTLILLGGVLAVASALRFFRLGEQSLWMDEARQASYYFSVSNIISMIGRAATQQQPPLDYLIGYIFTRGLTPLFGFQEWIVRTPAAIFGVLTVAALFYFVLELTRSKWAAFMAALLICFSPVMVWASQEARPYSIYFFLLVYWSWAWLRWVRGHISGRHFQWATFLFLISRGMAPVIWIAVGVGLAWLLRAGSPENSHPAWRTWLKSYWKILKWPILAFLPFQIQVFLSSGQYLSGAAAVKTGIDLWGVFIKLLAILKADVFAGPLWWGFVLCWMGFGVLALKKRGILGFTFLWITLEPIVHAFVFHVLVKTSVANMQGRYFLHTVLGFAVLLSLGFAEIEKAIALKRGMVKPIYFVRFGLAVLTFLFVTLWWPKLEAHYRFQKTDYRGAWAYLLSQGQWPGENQSDDGDNREKAQDQVVDVAIFESFQAHGAWESPFYGEGFYYPREAMQFSVNELIDKIEAEEKVGSVPMGRVWLLLHESTPVGTLEAAGFEVQHFTGLTVARVTGEKTSWRLNLLDLVEKMLLVYPQDSSRIDLLSAIVRLTCPKNSLRAAQAIDEWRRYDGNAQVSPCPP